MAKLSRRMGILAFPLLGVEWVSRDFSGGLEMGGVESWAGWRNAGQGQLALHPGHPMEDFRGVSLLQNYTTKLTKLSFEN